MLYVFSIYTASKELFKAVVNCTFNFFPTGKPIVSHTCRHAYVDYLLWPENAIPGEDGSAGSGDSLALRWRVSPS